MIEINSQYDFFKNVRLDDDGNLLVALNGSGATEVFMYDTFADFPTTGNADSLYVAKDVNVIYRWDDILSTYVILNDPDVVNPDAPEEGQTFYVRLATANRLISCTYNNGTAGVGATLTGTANGRVADINVVDKVDATTANLGDVILVKNQASPLQNGIYEVTQLGDVSNPFILTRIAGYDQTAEVYPSIVFVSAGSNNINRYFTQSTANPIIGTNGLVYGVATTSQPASPLLFFNSVTTTALPTCVYANGTTYPTLPGWGATLTATVNGALGTINGVPMGSGARLIVKNQVNQAHNGTYTVTNAGSATQRWVLTRWLTDSSQWYNVREFSVTDSRCFQFGSRWSVSSPLTMSNLNYGITPIVFSQQNNVGLRNSAGAIYLSDSTINGQVELTNGRASILSSNGAVSAIIDMFDTSRLQIQSSDGSTNNSNIVLDNDGQSSIDITSIDGAGTSTINLNSDGFINVNANTRVGILSSDNGDIAIAGCAVESGNGNHFAELGANYNSEFYGGVYVEGSSTNPMVLVGSSNVNTGEQSQMITELSKIKLNSTDGTNNAYIDIGGNGSIELYSEHNNAGLNITPFGFNMEAATVNMNLSTNLSMDLTANNILSLVSTTNNVEILANADVNITADNGDINIIGNVMGGVNGLAFIADNNVILQSTTKNIILNSDVNGLPVYANDAAADADTDLSSGALYKVTGNRAVYQKP